LLMGRKGIDRGRRDRRPRFFAARFAEGFDPEAPEDSEEAVEEAEGGKPPAEEPEGLVDRLFQLRHQPLYLPFQLDQLPRIVHNVVRIR